MLTREEARDLDIDPLIDRCEEILGAYDCPGGIETQGQKLDRIDRTLDEMPQIYRWFLQLQSYFDYTTDWAAANLGQRTTQYKHNKQRRDHFARMASAAKQRYEAASRLVTVQTSFDATAMPRTRRVP